MADRKAGGEGFATAALATPIPHHRVFALFRAAPRQWMRAALSLGALDSPSRPSGPPSFELGMPELERPDRLVVPLSWSPNEGSERFERFVGAFVIEQDGDGARIRLEGATDGGSPAPNHALLEAVLRRVTRALDAL
ncbi:MAG: hypothetical protein M0004_02170 [Actinomycetota bacterium]|nr:hypothetical protein [Actinomycetota bacterium]